MAYEKKYPDGEGWNAGIRKGFTAGARCSECFEKQREIDRLREQVKALKAKLQMRQQSLKEGAFGKSTPSSQIPVKENSPEEQRKKKGGAKIGHKGHGRKSLHSSEATEVRAAPAPQCCPDCGFHLESRGIVERTVVDVKPIKAKRVVFRVWRGTCPGCLKSYAGDVPALPKFLYSNRLIAQAATMHYVHGWSLGKIVGMLGSEVTQSGLLAAFERLGKMSESAQTTLRDDYRQAAVKHADETGWRTDGRNGYAWLFASNDTTIFQFRETRSGRVAHQVFGQDPLPGVLVVDRYHAYNKLPCALQYCYAHLLRDVEKLEDEFPENDEIRGFVAQFAPLMTLGMRLRSQPISDRDYAEQASALARKMKEIVDQPSKHPGIQHIQSIFRDKEHRLYHWVKDRAIPCENNYAERELRPTVIARKTSFGSQSEKAAKTRGHIMSLLHTARKRLKNLPPEDWLAQSLDNFRHAPKVEWQLAPPPRMSSLLH